MPLFKKTTNAGEYVKQAMAGKLNGKEIYVKDNPKVKVVRSGSSSFMANMHGANSIRDKLPNSDMLGGGKEFKKIQKGYQNLAFAGKHKEAVEFVKKHAEALGIPFKSLYEDIRTSLNPVVLEHIDTINPTDIAGITYTRKVDTHDHPVAGEDQFTSNGLDTANILDHMFDAETKTRLQQRYGDAWRLMAGDIIAQLATGPTPNNRPTVTEAATRKLGGVILNEILSNEKLDKSMCSAHNLMCDRFQRVSDPDAKAGWAQHMATLRSNVTPGGIHHQQMMLDAKNANALTEDITIPLALAAAGGATMWAFDKIGKALGHSIDQDVYPPPPDNFPNFVNKRHQIKKDYMVFDNHEADELHHMLKTAQKSGDVSSFERTGAVYGPHGQFRLGYSVTAPQIVHDDLKKHLKDRGNTFYYGFGNE